MDLTSAWLQYLFFLMPYFFIYCVLAFGLNIQFGYTGLPNFTYITFVAAGAYFAGVTGLPRSNPTLHILYILGLGWPFPFTLLAGAVAAGLLGLGLGIVTLRRLRTDYLAIVTFAFGFIAYDFVGTYRPLFNGFDGISGITPPLNDILNLDYYTYPIFFAVLSGVIALVLFLVANRIQNSALGRTLRAIREDPDLAEALGKDTFRFRLVALVTGCVFAGIGGGLLIELVTAINPSSWATPESFIIFTALLVGGRANNWGAMLGSFLVPVALFEGSRFIPVPPEYTLQLQAVRIMVVGVILVLILWFRPEGILPEPKRFFGDSPARS